MTHYRRISPAQGLLTEGGNQALAANLGQRDLDFGALGGRDEFLLEGAPALPM